MIDLIVLFFKGVPEVLFGYLKGHDTNKHKRIMAGVIIIFLLPLAALQIFGVIERFQWFKNNPNSGYRNLPMPMDAGASAKEK